MSVDCMSSFLAFVVGLFVFQVRGVKKILGILGAIGAIMLMSTMMRNLTSLSLDSHIISSAITSFIIGSMISKLSYKIGANISRYEQFGTLSPKIVYYTIMIVLLLMFFNIQDTFICIP